MARILIVDDEVGIRELLSEILSDEGHEVRLAENAQAARRAREAERPDLVLLDIWMPDADGITLLKEWAASGQLTMPVVMMSGHGTIETAVQATRLGALDYLEKPIALERLLATVARALRGAAAAPRAALSVEALGRSPVLAELRRRLAQYARSSAPVLLRGEPGMMPQLFARALAAPGAPFVTVREALADASSELLQRAAGGVLFVAELEGLGRAELKGLEFVLARAERQRVRLSAFTTLDPRTLGQRLGAEVAGLARLCEFVLALPPVREWREDVPELAARLLACAVEAGAAPPRRLSAAAQEALARHSWPGNVAELDAVVRNAALAALESEIGAADVARALAAFAPAPPPVAGVAFELPYRAAREAFDRLYFERLIAEEGGSIARVAERAGLERTHLYRKLRALGLPAGRREETNGERSAT